MSDWPTLTTGQHAWLTGLHVWLTGLHVWLTGLHVWLTDLHVWLTGVHFRLTNQHVWLVGQNVWWLNRHNIYRLNFYHETNLDNWLTTTTNNISNDIINNNNDNKTTKTITITTTTTIATTTTTTTTTSSSTTMCLRAILHTQLSIRVLSNTRKNRGWGEEAFQWKRCSNQEAGKLPREAIEFESHHSSNVIIVIFETIRVSTETETAVDITVDSGTWLPVADMGWTWPPSKGQFGPWHSDVSEKFDKYSSMQLYASCMMW